MEIASIPTKRVYKLPDFVIFSHARHLNAKIDCVRCHGPVQERDRVDLEVDHSMKACLNCHRQSKATVVCLSCHELGQ
jgi:formate-dependent nitrite reductase cytochrome c552 subunit